MIGRALILRTAALGPIEKTVRRSRLFKPLVSRFIAGDNLDEALAASTKLLDKNLNVTLDYLGENTSSEDEAMSARSTYIEMLRSIGGLPSVQSFAAADPTAFQPEPLNISIKLTQCGMDQGTAFAEANYRQVVEFAAQSSNFVRVDMESSEYTDRTLEIVTRVLETHKNTGTVLQSYLHRNDNDVDLMIGLQARVRLVKGAYLEPSSVAYPEKEKVDEAFVRQSKRLLSHGFYPAIATHDEAIIRELTRYVEQEKLDKGRFEFQMLYGIRRDLQESLRGDGYNVRIYVPFGDKWYPYFTRRLAERPANAFFIVRSLFKG
jgi:proline dehydrogenase